MGAVVTVVLEGTCGPGPTVLAGVGVGSGLAEVCPASASMAVTNALVFAVIPPTLMVGLAMVAPA